MPLLRFGLQFASSGRPSKSLKKQMIPSECVLEIFLYFKIFMHLLGTRGS